MSGPSTWPRAAIDPNGTPDGWADLGHLKLEYQPIRELDSGAIVAAEALVRLDHPRLGVLGPDQFLGWLRAEGRMGELARWELTEIARLMTLPGVELARRLRTIWVNVPPSALGEPGMAEGIEDLIAAHGLPPGSIGIELTEEEPVPEELRSAVATLRAHGVRVALDDLGTGFNGLLTLQDLAVDVVKLDSELTAPLADPSRVERQRGFLQQVLGLIEFVGATPLAEGIADERHLAELRSLGCPLGSGWLLGRPGSLRQLVQLLDRQP